MTVHPLPAGLKSPATYRVLEKNSIGEASIIAQPYIGYVSNGETESPDDGTP